MSALNTARSTAFIRLRQEGRTDEVARRLVEAIELGLFAEGQQLPSESELALQLGVATVTLREALVVLRQRGLIETRRGRNGGSFVCAPVELPDLEYRTCATATKADARLAEERMIGRREAYMKGAA